MYHMQLNQGQLNEIIKFQSACTVTGSHAALTCHICLMRHTETGVVSIGHFDNFCCWQFGEESSAHKDGIQIMLEEIGRNPGMG